MTAGKRASAGPLGLLGFALTTALLQGGRTHIVEGATTNLVYGMALAFGGAAQAIAGIIELLHGTTLSGVAFVTYGAFWIGWALNGLFVASGVFPAPAPHGEQFLLGLWGLVTFFFFCAALCVNMMLQALFLVLAVVFWLLSAGVTRPGWDQAAGWVGLCVAGIAFYGAAAELLNEYYHKTVLPLGPCKPGNVLLPYLQRGVGAIPLLGPMYLRAVEREDRLAGYHPVTAPAAAAWVCHHDHLEPTPITANSHVKPVEAPCRMSLDMLLPYSPSHMPSHAVHMPSHAV